MYGLFFGTTVSSIVLFIFRIIPISTFGTIIILYLYAVVGGVTGYIIHKKLETDSSKKASPINQKINNQILLKENLFNSEEYEQVSNKIKNLKKTFFMVKSLIETRKKIQELKKENDSILEDIVDKMITKIN